MNIGLLHNSILPPKTYGGIERIVMALAKEYTRLGYQVVLFCRKGSRKDLYETIELPEGYDGEDISSLIPKDLAFLHSHQPLRVKPPVPFLVTIHGNGHPSETYFPNTNFLSQSHARNHGAKYFIYNGVDPDHYPFAKAKDDYFVFLAKTTWRVKNVKTAIAWARELGVRLEIMGGGGASMGGIHYNGMADEPTKLRLLAGARALIYPTNWDEPCAAAPLEALACGTPVIGSVNGCMPELVRPGTGVVCENYGQLLASVRQLDEIRPEDCRKAVEGFFSLSRMAQDYLQLFHRILQRGELDHSPKYCFKPDSVKWVYKPTVWNSLRLSMTGKV